MSRYSVHPMEKKFIKDTTGVDLDAPPQLTNDQFQNLRNGRPKDAPRPDTEIESLRKQVAELEDDNARITTMYADTRDHVTKLEKELREALEYAADLTKPEGMSGCDCPICKALVTKDDTSALEAYRNSVIAELEKERGYDPVTISENTMNNYRNAVIDECATAVSDDAYYVEKLLGMKR